MIRPLRRVVPNRLRGSFGAKLVVALAVVVLVVAGFGGYIYFHTGSTLRHDTQRQLATNSEIQADNLNEWMNRMTVQMESVSESAAFQSDDQSEITIQLWDIVNRDDQIEAAYYVDTRSNSVITSTGSTRVVSADGVLKRSGQHRLTSVEVEFSEGVFVSKPFRSYDGGAPVLLFVTGVPNKPNHAVVVVVNLNKLSSQLLHRIDAAQFVVVNGSGTVVMAENEERILTRDRIDEGRVTGRPGFLTVGSGSSSTAVGYAPVESRDWVVTARVPTRDAYALQTDISEQILGMLLVTFGCAAAISLFGRNTVASIRELAGEARRLEKGDLETTVETERTDELGDLFRAFETMRQSLKREIETSERARREAEAARRSAEEARRKSELLTDHLERKANEYSEVMQRCANGDLGERVEQRSESDAMEAIGVAFNEMMDDVQEQNDQLEAVTTILSHDLRNPLTVALGRAAMVAADADSENIARVRDALDRMDAIIEDALVLARGGVGERRTLDLRIAAERAWNHVETESATLLIVDSIRFDADPNALGHVFENLFRNAIDHGNGEANVRVGALEGGFFVEDDGRGIDAPDRERVFELGYTTNGSEGGTGFGLPIVKRGVEAHGWTVRVTEGSDGGARFEVRDVC